MSAVQERANLDDKSAWGPGPWQAEPDKIQWVDEATDLDCLMRRGPAGAWCGYVGVAQGHPAFGQGYGEVEDLFPALSVHGGLTYAALCDGDEESGICHVPEQGRPENVWWLGFDCAHAFDLMPRLAARERERGWAPPHPDVYRDRAYVAAEVASLARQLADLPR